jgi:hypothetical protein
MSKYLALLAKPAPLRKLSASMLFPACTDCPEAAKNPDMQQSGER